MKLRWFVYLGLVTVAGCSSGPADDDPQAGSQGRAGTSGHAGGGGGPEAGAAAIDGGLGGMSEAAGSGGQGGVSAAGSGGQGGMSAAGSGGQGGQGGSGGAAVRDPYPRPCSHWVDRDGDGNTDYAFHYTFDDQGRAVRMEHDTQGDGLPNRVSTYHYDGEGRLVRSELDSDNDGVVDAMYTYEFNPDGTRARDVDLDRDGAVTRSRDYLYDERGFLVGSVENLAPSGRGTSRMIYENDEDGCTVAVWQDNGDDGTIDFYSTYRVDDACRPLERVMDEGNDGTVDWIETHTYDADGNVLTHTRRRTSGLVEYQRVNHYENGLLVRSELSGTAGSSVTTHTYDLAGNLLRSEVDRFGDGRMVSITIYEIDARGNVLRKLEDDDGDGVPDRIDTFSYACWQ